MTPCDQSRLEAWIDGTLDPTAAAELEAHVHACVPCREEAAWLRDEAAWMDRRRQAQPALRAEVWQSVAQRVGGERHRRRRPTLWMAGVVAAAAAAVVLMIRLPGPQPITSLPSAIPSQRPSPDAEVLQAEQHYDQALALLEAEYRRQRPALPPALAARYDDTLSRTRASLVQARRDAGHDVEARAALLDGYADYVWSLQTIVADLQVNR
jgi:hypothetical protein